MWGLLGARRVLECHVHFTEPVWQGAAIAPAPRLTEAMRSMLLWYGFVHVLDTGSDLDNTVALRRRIDVGEIAGPEILTAGPPFGRPEGTPFYLKSAMTLPELRTGLAASDSVASRFRRGADFVKVFAGSPVELTKVVVMPEPILGAAAQAAHREGRFTAAHPTNNAGVGAGVASCLELMSVTRSGTIHPSNTACSPGRVLVSTRSWPPSPSPRLVASGGVGRRVGWWLVNRRI